MLDLPSSSTPATVSDPPNKARLDPPTIMHRRRWWVRGVGLAAWVIWFATVKLLTELGWPDWSGRMPAAQRLAQAAWLLTPPALVMLLLDAWEVTTFAGLTHSIARRRTWL